MRFVFLLIAAAVVIGASSGAGMAGGWFSRSETSAEVYHGNDTGGIISWSCDNEADAHEIAAAYCARWDKYHRITSVHRQYGDYIAFACLWSPYVNPYAIPAVRTRKACYHDHGIVVKALN